MKKLLSFVLVFVMCLSFFTPYASAVVLSYEDKIGLIKEEPVLSECNLHLNSDEKDEGSFAFYLNDGEYTVGHYEGDEEEVFIPAFLNGIPVTRIDSQLWCECALNDTVKKIVIPETVKYINIFTFELYSKLECLEVAEGNENFCTKDGILFNKETTQLLYCAPQKIREYTVPDTVMEIGYDAFKPCDSLENIVLPENLKIIGDYAFSGCAALESITIPSKVETIGVSAFSYCEKLEEVIIPNSVKTVGERAFSNCSSLKKVVLGDGLKSIRVDVLEECDAIEYISFGKGLENVESPIFLTKPNLKAVEVSGKNKNYCAVDGVLFDKAKETLLIYPPQKTGEVYDIPYGVKTIASEAFKNCNYLTYVTISDSVQALQNGTFFNAYSLKNIDLGNGITSIGSGAFASCTALESITLPSTVKEINNSAFRNCKYLKEVILPDEVETMGKSVFENCESLEKIILPNGLSEIDAFMFSGCESLKNIFIPETVNEINLSVFEDCISLESIEVSENNAKYGDAGGALIEKSEYPIMLICPLGTIGSYAVPEAVKKIGENAFNNCDKIIDVTVHDGVLTMGEGAFYDCDALKSIQLGEGIREIPTKAFMDCDVLESIVFEKTLGTIGEQAFYNCDSIKSIAMTETVGSIGNYAFARCDGLEDIVVANRLITKLGEGVFYNCDSLKRVEVGKGITKIPAKTFMDCDVLENITFNESVEEIGERVFYNCDSIKNIEFLNAVDYIEKYAFSECDGLEDVVISGNVKMVQAGAFSKCDSLKTVEIGAGVLYIQSDAFAYCPSIEKISVDEANKDYSVVDGALLSRYSLLVYPVKGTDSVYIIPEQISTIEEGAFCGCNNISKLIIGKAVRSIQDDEFIDCTSLESIEVSEENANYKTIDGVLFNKNGDTLICYPPQKRDSSYTVPDIVQNINENAFYGEGKIKSITVGSNVKDICAGHYFSDLKSIENIEVSEENQKFSAVDGVLYNKDKSVLLCYPSRKKGIFELPASVEDLYYFAFKNCGELLGIEVAEGNEYFASIDGVLFNKAKTTLVTFPGGRGGTYTIPEGVGFVANGAIRNNSYLKTLVIPHDVTVNSSAFYNCTALENIIVLNGAEFYIRGDAGAFSGTDNVTVYLYDNATAASENGEHLKNVKIVQCDGETPEILAVEPLWSSGYTVDYKQNLLNSVKMQTSVKEFLANMKNSDKLIIKNINGETINDENALIGTGFIVDIIDSKGNIAQSVKIIIDGDIDGDAKVNSKDLAKLQKHIAGTEILSAVFFVAGDVLSDDTLNSRDIASLQRMISK